MAFERILTEALRDVIGELFFVNAGALVADINTDKAGNIEDFVASSAERSLRPGALRYGGHACAQFDWGCPPQVTVPLEFQYDGVAVYFELIFEATTVGVRISGIAFPDRIDSFAERLSRFEAALAAARRLDS